MPPLIGEMLVAQGDLTAENLQEALDWQVLYGGRLGTNLLELRLCTEEQFARTLGRQLGAEVTWGEIAVDPALLPIVPKHVAARYEIVPWRQEKRRLKILCIDINVAVLDELTYKTGRTCVAVVAPEFRVAQLLRTHYQIARQVRALDLGVVPEEGRRPKKKEPGTAIEAAPELIDESAFNEIYAQVLEGREKTKPEQWNPAQSPPPQWPPAPGADWPPPAQQGWPQPPPGYGPQGQPLYPPGGFPGQPYPPGQYPAQPSYPPGPYAQPGQAPPGQYPPGYAPGPPGQYPPQYAPYAQPYPPGYPAPQPPVQQQQPAPQTPGPQQQPAQQIPGPQQPAQKNPARQEPGPQGPAPQRQASRGPAPQRPATQSAPPAQAPVAAVPPDPANAAAPRGKTSTPPQSTARAAQGANQPARPPSAEAGQARGATESSARSSAQPREQRASAPPAQSGSAPPAQSGSALPAQSGSAPPAQSGSALPAQGGSAAPAARRTATPERRAGPSPALASEARPAQKSAAPQVSPPAARAVAPPAAPAAPAAPDSARGPGMETPGAGGEPAQSWSPQPQRKTTPPVVRQRHATPGAGTPIARVEPQPNPAAHALRESAAPPSARESAPQVEPAQSAARENAPQFEGEAIVELLPEDAILEGTPLDEIEPEPPREVAATPEPAAASADARESVTSVEALVREATASAEPDEAPEAIAAEAGNEAAPQAPPEQAAGEEGGSSDTHEDLPPIRSFHWEAEPEPAVVRDESPLEFKEALQALAGVTDRDEIARVVLRASRAKAARALLLQVQAGIALGWDGMGEGLDEAAVRSVAMPLSAESAFSLVVQTRSHYMGPLRKTKPNIAFLAAIGKRVPKSSLIFPILHQGRVSHMLYLDNGHGQQAPTDVGEMLILCQRISQTVEALVQRKRQGPRA